MGNGPRVWSPVSMAMPPLIAMVAAAVRVAWLTPTPVAPTAKDDGRVFLRGQRSPIDSGRKSRRRTAVGFGLARGISTDTDGSAAREGLSVPLACRGSSLPDLHRLGNSECSIAATTRRVLGRIISSSAPSGKTSLTASPRAASEEYAGTLASANSQRDRHVGRMGDGLGNWSEWGTARACGLR